MLSDNIDDSGVGICSVQCGAGTAHNLDTFDDVDGYDTHLCESITKNVFVLWDAIQQDQYRLVERRGKPTNPNHRFSCNGNVSDEKTRYELQYLDQVTCAGLTNLLGRDDSGDGRGCLDGLAIAGGDGDVIGYGLCLAK